MLDTTLLRLTCPPADPPRDTMFKFEIYDIDAAESLGIYAARTESEALDQMARALGFDDYADCIRESHSRGRESEIAHHQHTSRLTRRHRALFRRRHHRRLRPSP
ncbi:MAG: hypothetical protein WB820_17230 [Rhodoplanes sp.]